MMSIRRATAVAVSFILVGLGAPSAAWAQAAPETAEQAPSGQQPAADVQTVARDQFKAGNDLYDEQRYEESLAAFKASYKAVPSPNSRLMIARSLWKLGRLAEAYSELERTVREAADRGEKYKNAGDAAAHDIGVLRPQIGMLHVKLVDAPEGTLVTIGSRDFIADTIRGPLPVLPGQVTVVASSDGRQVTSVAEIGPGGEGTVELVLTPPPPPSPQPVASPPKPAPPPDDGDDRAALRTAAFIAGGVGVAGLATFGIFGALNQSKFSDLEDGCPNSVCPPDLEGDIDTGRTYQTVANIGLVVGLVGVASGATLFVLSSGGGGDSADRARLEVAGGLGSVHVKGAF